MAMNDEQAAGEAKLEEVLTTVAQMAAEYLDDSSDRDVPVRRAHSPAEIRAMVETTPDSQGRQLSEVLGDFRQVLEASVRTTHPRFANQLFVGAELSGIVGEWLTALLDSTMATFEMTPVATVMERDLIGKMCSLAGFDDGEGILTPGGSISNLMAVLVARNQAYPRARLEGMAGKKPPALFASEVAHYSIRRAANILGLGVDAVYPVAVDDRERMCPDALRDSIEKAREDGRKPFFVCATAGTTVAGAYDPVDAVADVCEDEGLWFHVDGAYGGAALLSQKHRGLLDGTHRADSMTWCPHKMMGLPLVCSALLMRRKGLLEKSLSVAADYIFHETAEGSCDLGNTSLQCGRRVDSIKLWLAWQVRGDEGYERLVNRFFSMAEQFAHRVRKREHFELVRVPESCNVLFHYVPPSLRDMEPGAERDEALDRVTRQVREEVKDDGRVMVNFAPVDGVATFRMVVINPRMEPRDLDVFLDEIERVANRQDAERGTAKARREAG